MTKSITIEWNTNTLRVSDFDKDNEVEVEIEDSDGNYKSVFLTVHNLNLLKGQIDYLISKGHYE